MTAWAPDELPVMISSLPNLSCDEIKILLLFKSSARTVAVAFDVEPVIVSPTVNLPKDESSN